MDYTTTLDAVAQTKVFIFYATPCVILFYAWLMLKMYD